MVRVGPYELSDRDVQLVIMIYAKKSLLGIMAKKKPLPVSTSSASLKAAVANQDVADAVSSATETIDVLRENFKILSPGMIYDPIKGFASIGVEPPFILKPGMVFIGKPPQLGDRPLMLDRYNSELTKRVSEAVLGKSNQFPSPDPSIKAFTEHFHRIRQEELAKVLTKNLDDIQHGSKVDIGLLKKVVASHPAPTTPKVVPNAPATPKLSQADMSLLKKTVAIQNMKNVPKTSVTSKDIMKQIKSRAAARAAASAPTSIPDTPSNTKFCPDKFNAKSAVAGGLLIGTLRGLYNYDILLKQGSKAYARHFGTCLAESTATSIAVGGIKAGAGKAIAKATGERVFSEVGNYALESCAGVFAGVAVSGVQAAYGVYDTGDWERSGKTLGLGTLTTGISAGVGWGVVYLGLLTPTGWGVVLVVAGTGLVCNIVYGAVGLGSGKTTLERRKCIEKMAKEFMKKNPGTFIDTKKLTDEAIKKMDMENPVFKIGFTKSFIKAVEDNERHGKAIPVRYEQTYKILNNIPGKASPPIPNISVSQPQACKKVLDPLFFIICLPIVLQAAKFDSVNITRGLELYFQSLGSCEGVFGLS